MQISRFLAARVLTGVIGLEAYAIQHVQGGLTTGYRLQDEARTLMVAMMRRGEPLALGDSETYPSPAFLHERNSGDIKHTLLQGCDNIWHYRERRHRAHSSFKTRHRDTYNGVRGAK